MRLILPAAACLLCACGPLTQGTWRNTTDVATPSGTQRVIYDVVIDGRGWDAGGGCIAPLAHNDKVSQIEKASWTCRLASAAGIPLIELLSYTFKSGDELLVKSARFEVLDQDHLQVQFSLQIRTDPTDLSVGPTIEFQSKAGTGAERVK